MFRNTRNIPGTLCPSGPGPHLYRGSLHQYKLAELCRWRVQTTGFCIIQTCLVSSGCGKQGLKENKINLSLQIPLVPGFRHKNCIVRVWGQGCANVLGLPQTC